MKVEAYGLTDVGIKRRTNQDAILVSDKLKLYAVADGMGGHKGGEVASSLSLKVTEDFFRENKEMAPEAMMSEIYRRACEKVYDKSQVDTNLQGMGTTLVLLFIRDNMVYFGNVGDSRCYMFKEDRLWQITEDHSLVNEHLKTGVIEEKDIEHFEAKNVITRSVGFERSVECDYLSRKVKSDETYILCSDGLHGLVSNEKILQICREEEVKNWPELMINEAKVAGGDDNVSVVVVSVKV